jgi:hypothetical protein
LDEWARLFEAVTYRQTVEDSIVLLRRSPAGAR